MSETKVLQDTVDFSLVAEETMKSDTVKVVASLSGIISPDAPEATVRDAVRNLMRAFMADVTWQFSGMSRSAHASGQEMIALTASARVPETENYGLDRRAREASATSPSVSIASVWTDTTPPLTLIDTTQSSLRLTLFKRALEERDEFNRAEPDGVTRPYRLHEVTFELDSGKDPMANAANFRGGKVAYGSGMDDDGTLGNATKLTMRARVRLARAL